MIPGVPSSDRAWMIACCPTALGGLGVPALADFADAAFVASFVNSMVRAPLLYPWAASLFDYVPGASINEPVEAALARIVSRAPIFGTFVNLSVPDLDANLQARIMREIHNARLMVVHGMLSEREQARLIS